MKNIVLEFIKRGLIASGFGPIVLALFYMILYNQGKVQMLNISEVCLGIISLYTLAFIVGGMNVIYQIEQLPLMIAIFIHGVILYMSYLATYLVNGWLQLGMTHILVFSIIFVVTYIIIWIIIYTTTKKRTERINEILKLKQQNTKL